eukprot:4228650-Prymnesium_polylepis.1
MSAPLHVRINHHTSANSRGQPPGRAFRLRLMSPRAYRDREAKQSEPASPALPKRRTASSDGANA